MKTDSVTGRKAPVFRSKPFWQRALLLFGLIFTLASSSPAQNTTITEYQLKAAFIYNFVKFVDWPPTTFTNASEPYVIGVLGDNVFGDELEQAIANKTINGRALVCQKFRSAREAVGCQVLFISSSEKLHFKRILADLRGQSILTISEADGFIDDGGIINFVPMPDRTVRFQINQQAAKDVRLQISSDLLNLALTDH